MVIVFIISVAQIRTPLTLHSLKRWWGHHWLTVSWSITHLWKKMLFHINSFFYFMPRQFYAVSFFFFKVLVSRFALRLFLEAVSFFILFAAVTLWIEKCKIWSKTCKVHPTTAKKKTVSNSLKSYLLFCLTALYTTLSGKTAKSGTSIEYVLDHNELHDFAQQIACGMHHLEKIKITHR